MSGSLIPNGKQQYLDANGAPLAGGKVYYYIPYTTTAKNTWQDINLTILNTNPIILDSAGECIAWGSGAYRQQIYDVNDNLIWDQYTYGISPAGSNFISQEEVQTATQGQIVFTLATITYVPGINSLVVFVNGSKQVTGTNYTETAGNTVTFVTGLNAGDVVDFYASLPASAQNMSNAVNVAYVPPFPASATTNVQAKLAQTISVKDFGAKGDGTTDDTAAIQAAISYVQGLQNRPTILFPVGTYLTSSTITVTGDNVSLVGLGTPSIGAGSHSTPSVGVTRGATIYYTGTGNAITIGVAPSVNGTFISEIWVENLRIEVQNNSTCGLYVWMCSQSYFKNINVFGNKSNGTINQSNGTGNSGITIAGSISTIVEQVDITGFGQTNGSTVASYLNYGLVATAGYLNSSMTTTTFRKCYLHYCNVGAFVANIATFEDCIFEANDVGITAGSNAYLNVYRGWWEANQTYDVLFSSNNTGYIKDGNINAYSRQEFFNSGGLATLSIEDTIFASTNSAPYLFGVNPTGSNIFNPSLTYAGAVNLNNNILPHNFQIGYVYDNSTVNLIQVENMRKETYRFTAQSVGASSAPTMIAATGFSQYTMAEAGHVIEANIYTSSAITAGQFDAQIYINGTVIPAFNAVLVSTSSPFQYRIAPYIAKFNKGDVITVYFHTGSTWSPTNNVCFEVIAAHGPDGVI